MRFLPILTILMIAAIGLAGAQTCHAATIVFSDDFSNPSGGTGFSTYTATGRPMGQWKVDRASVDLIGGYWQAPTVGGGSVDLDGNFPGSISQTLTLNPGKYELSFSLSGNPGAGDPLKSVLVSIGNASEVFSYNTQVNGTTKENMKYITEFLSFSISGLASKDERRLSFISQSPSGKAGAVIGNIQIISAVPLPASLQLFLTALIGVMAFGFFRRHQAI